MKTREINKMLKYTSKDKTELLGALLRKVSNGNIDSLALAYLINEFVPDDRTTKHVFECVIDE